MSYLLIGLAATELSAPERDWLAWPQVGGVVLFSRNYTSPAQLRALVAQIREINPEALLCVDQEGGGVQRIKAPCTVLPPLGSIGRVYNDDRPRARELAYAHGALMASEMRALGLDLSFAPVLDLDRGSRVIGVRAFHRDGEAVADLSGRYIAGMAVAGMPACGKHFPGHGSVLEDTHHEVAIDGRDWDAIAEQDLRPFAAAIERRLAAVMMAHVRYPRVCRHAAGYSRVWIQEILRGRLGFDGAVISDDLGMRAAAEAGGWERRIADSLEAGCDLLLVCRPGDVRAALAAQSNLPTPLPGPARGTMLRGRNVPADPDALASWRTALNELTWQRL